MSGAQNGISIAILAGIFTVVGTIIGAIIGSVLEYLREKRQFSREAEKAKNEIIEKNKRTYLSPLSFHLCNVHLAYFHVNLELVFKQPPEKFEGLLELKEISNNVESINKLMRENMHILPIELNSRLIFHVSSISNFLRTLQRVKQVIDTDLKEGKEPKCSTVFFKNMEKTADVLLEMNQILAVSVYGYMINNRVSEKLDEIEKLGNELGRLSAEMIESS